MYFAVELEEPELVRILVQYGAKQQPGREEIIDILETELQVREIMNRLGFPVDATIYTIGDYDGARFDR